jgi:hypothetical protein
MLRLIAWRRRSAANCRNPAALPQHPSTDPLRVARLRGRVTAVRWSRVVLVGVLALGACSGGGNDEARVEPSIQVETIPSTTTPPPTQTVLATVPPTTASPAPTVRSTVPMTISSTPPSVISSGQGSPEDLTEVTSQALAAIDFDTAMMLGSYDTVRAVEIFTPNALKQLPELFQSFNSNRRWERGPTDRRVPFEVRFDSTGNRASVRVCERNGMAEFDSKGTGDPVDDELIQDALEIRFIKADVVRISGRWLVDGYEPEEDGGACDASV